jgi:hypothetical protein
LKPPDIVDWNDLGMLLTMKILKKILEANERKDKKRRLYYGG